MGLWEWLNENWLATAVLLVVGVMVILSLLQILDTHFGTKKERAIAEKVLAEDRKEKTVNEGTKIKATKSSGLATVFEAESKMLGSKAFLVEERRKYLETLVANKADLTDDEWLALIDPTTTYDKEK